MGNRLKELQRRAREFFLDVHSVSRNFLGENDWQWRKPSIMQDSMAQRFTDEMMSDTQFYTNDSNVEDRITLAVAASLYSIPYAAGRLIYDGLLNTSEYPAQRITGNPETCLHPEPRKLNGYVLGAPVSAAPIIAMGAIENIFRALGLSAYGGHIIKAAGKRAGNFPRYMHSMTGGFDDASITSDQSAVLSLPKSGWDAADRVGLITIPGAVAALEIVGASALTVIAGAFESLGRIVGISPYGKAIISSAGKRASNFPRYMHRITGGYDAASIKEDEDIVFSSPKDFWSVIDRVGIATVPAVIATTELVGASAFTMIAFGFEILGRTLGISAYGKAIIKSSGKRAGNFPRYMHKLTGGYDTASIKKDQDIVFSLPDDGWSAVDRVGLISIPAIIATLELSGAAALTVIAGGFEILGRTLGISAYGKAIIRAADKRTVNLSRYTRALACKKYNDEDIKADQDIVFSLPENGWGVADRVGLVTFPAIIASLELFAGTVITAVGGIGEIMGRLLGISAYGKSVILAAGKRTANLSRYTRAMFKTHDAKPDQDDVLTLPKNSWDVVDRFGLVTFPGLIAGLELAAGLAITAIAGTGEILGRMLGISSYGKATVLAAGKRVANFSRYTRAMFGAHDAKPDQDAVLTLPKNVWDVADRFGLVTFPGLIAGVELLAGAAITAVAGTSEILGRLLGISAYGKAIVLAAGKRMANFSRYTRGMFGAHDAKADQDVVLSLPKNGWGVIDRVGLLTFPGLIAGVELAAGAAITAIAGAGEILGRVLGISAYGKAIVLAAGKRTANLSHYTRSMFGAHDAKPDQDVVLSLPKNAWGVADLVGLFTFPGLIAGVELAAGIAITAIAGAGEILGRVLGISAYGKAIILAAGKRMANLSRYTRAMFGAHDAKPDQDVVLSLPKNGWGVADRLGLLTFPGLIAGIELFAGLAITAIAGTGEILGRVLGISAYGKAIVKAAGKRTANLSRYTRAMFGAHDAKPDQDIVLSLPQNGWGVIDRVGLVTFPGLIAGIELTTGIAITAIAGISESIGRGLGISKRSLNSMQVVFAKCANMLGVSDPADLREKITTVKAPIKSWWNAMDCIGVAITGTITAALSSIVIAPLAIIGISKSNYHRFNYYRQRIDNLIRHRHHNDVDDSKEIYHCNQLARCEETILGKALSHANIFNVIGHAAFWITRYIAAPVIYASFRACKNLLGVIPITKAIYRTVKPVKYDLNTPADRIRKRFADLEQALNVSGHLPASLGTEYFTADVELTLEVKKNQNIFQKAGFGLFSEGRKIVSIGHTPEERVLAEFSNRFEEFLNARQHAEKRGKSVNVNSFFSKDIPLDKGQRFTYEVTLDNVKNHFSDPEDQAVIEQVASYLKADIEKNLQPTFKP